MVVEGIVITLTLERQCSVRKSVGVDVPGSWCGRSAVGSKGEETAV